MIPRRRGLQMYDYGFYGKGTVSRRLPNSGAFEVVVEEEAGAAASTTAAEVATAAASSDALEPGHSSSHEGGGMEPPHAKRARHGEDGTEEGGVRELAASSTDAGLPSSIVDDVLSQAATHFEERVAKTRVPEAYASAAFAFAHGQEPAPFELSRSIAHYVSCPPPRTRH
ncbi:hypothetical protein EON67_01425, partial [archaeon]